jgi:hypothetical protein
VQILLEFDYKVDLEFQELILLILEREKKQLVPELYLRADLNMLVKYLLKDQFKQSERFQIDLYYHMKLKKWGPMELYTMVFTTMVTITIRLYFRLTNLD